ncbi:MAG TPA: hypothetical protein VHF47_01010 [Acidimicrobiales bacterium]|nr:hypothetical protein [Acidimicrobiales bacterium]
MRSRALAVLAIGVLLVAAACGDDGDDEAGDTTTTTASTTTTTPLPDYSRYRSSDQVAINLDQSIMTATEVQAAAGLSATPVEYKGTGNSPPPPQGPLNLDGMVAVFPSPAYKGALEDGKASVGANKTVADAASGRVFNILAVKFESAATGGNFVKFATNVATTLGGAKVADHPEFKVGVLPGQVVRVPPSAGATPPTEIVVATVMYPNGVYYQASITAPVGTVTDEAAIAFVRAQDAKYQSVKARLNLG